jgi:hypothetical protein
MEPTVGRIVEYVLKDKYGKLQVRPAIIVRVWSDTCVQLQVFTDGTNDGPEYASGLYWATSVIRCENKTERTWDWMDYQKGQAKKTEELEAKLAEAEVEESYLNHEPKEEYAEDLPAKFDFGQAVQLLKAGFKLARSGWNGAGMFVVYQKGYPDGIPCNKQTADAWGYNEGDLFKVRPYLQLKTAQGDHAMWSPSTSDALADDWEVVE